MDALLAVLGLGRVEAGRPVLRDFFGVDRGLVCRWTEATAHLMPHGGPFVVRAITDHLRRAGLNEDIDPDPRAVYPEAADEIEARMLTTMARAASPAAIDLLADQPRRWRELGPGAEPDAGCPGRSVILNRLVDPPLVAAVGPPNVGKSTLLNALAGRTVSVVADEPGTTRDYVGAMIDAAGLVVRYIDTPGLGSAASRVDLAAQASALAAAAGADLILACGDARSPPPDPLPAGCSAAPAGVLRVGLRQDLAPAAWAHDAAVCSRDGRGIAELVALVKERLAPAWALQHPGPWRFWT